MSDVPVTTPPAPVQPTPPATTPSTTPATPKPVQTALHLVVQLKSQEDSQQLQAQLLEGMAGMQEGMDAVGTVHFAHWFFLDDGMRVILTTEYDGDFETYILAFVKSIGDLFDGLLAHVADPPPMPIQQNPQAFVQWIAAHNVPVWGNLIVAYPTLTVLAIRNLEKLAASGS